MQQVKATNNQNALPQITYSKEIKSYQKQTKRIPIQINCIEDIW